MNDFVTEFEQYLAKNWEFKFRYGTFHGTFGFYQVLWSGDAIELNTLYGKAKVVERSTDYADGQEERTMVVKIGDRFVKKVGYYDSWDSSDWDGSITEVKPVDRIVTVYEPV